jgi:FMNH2-dependent dimethyl sulfone monooxygenase
MIECGIYLPIYGGWLRDCGAEKEEAPEYGYVRQAALEAEKIGLDFLWIPDHLLNPIKGELQPSLEAWTLASALCEATRRIRIAHTCICEGFRHPAVLAKQVACIHHLSGRRYLFCIGAGWHKREYQAYGLRFYGHDRRIERTREAIQIMTRLWRENGVSFKGKYYSIADGALEPKIGEGYPLWYAGMSEASRELVADLADGWLMGESSEEQLAEAIRDMRARLATRNRTAIGYAVPANTIVRPTDKEARAVLKGLRPMSPRAARQMKNTALVGSYEEIADRIRSMESLGIGQVIFKLSPTLAELPHVEKLLARLR